MGAKSSKNELKQIGQDANKSDPSSFLSYTPINITSDVIVSESKTDPSKDYKTLKYLGEGSFAAVHQVQNKYTGSICAMKVIKKKYSCSTSEEREIRNEINIFY